MNAYTLLFAWELVIAASLAIILLLRLPEDGLVRFLLSVGWHGPGDGS